MNEASLLDRDQAEIYAEWFRTLSDATRVQLLHWLAQQPVPVEVGAITRVFPRSQSTISHHLAALTAAGFLTMRRDGRSSLYAVNPACLADFPNAADLITYGAPCCPRPQPVLTPERGLR